MRSQCSSCDWSQGVQKRRKVLQLHIELWLSLNLAVKEQNERVYKCGRECNFFCRECKFAFSQLDFMPRGMIWTFLGNFRKPFSPRKSGFFQRKGRKRVKEWREVTFMKEWVKALYIGYHQELDLPKNLFPFPRTVQLKISLGPIQFLYSKFYGLLKLIFLTNQYNGA